MVDINKDRQVHHLLNRLGVALEGLSEHGVDAERAFHLIAQRRDGVGIPVSIFNTDLAALESIVKYMKEDLLLDYDSIANLLGRNPGPIGVTYRRARQKSVQRSVGRLDTSSQETIPFTVLCAGAEKKLSVFESIAYYLAKQGHDWREIASMMCRHDKTVWTVLDRAKKKMKVRKEIRVRNNMKGRKKMRGGVER